MKRVSLFVFSMLMAFQLAAQTTEKPIFAE